MPLRCGVERRRYPRVEAAASVLVLTSQRYAGSYLVENLSVGGALLVGSAALTQEKRVLLLLQLPGEKQLSIFAEVIRHQRRENGEYSFGMSFCDVPARITETLRQVVFSLLEQGDTPRCVLVATNSFADYRALESELLDIGRRTVWAANSVEVVVRLEDPGARYEAACVDAELKPVSGTEVMQFLSREFKAIRRVLMVDGAIGATTTSATNDQYAQAVLAKPWVKEQLVRVLAKDADSKR